MQIKQELQGRFMRRVLVGVWLVLSVAMWTACGGDNDSATGVTISPSTPSVATSATQQFSATVTGTTDTTVFWQVNEISGGNPSVGTITSTGLFTAPGVIPSGGTVTVTAISQSDSTKKGSVRVTITQGDPIAITISPTSATVRGGQSRQFTATVTPATNSLVTWQVNDTTGGSVENGLISSDGLYTAPTTVPTNNVVTVKAISLSDSSKNATAQVTIIPAATVAVTPPTPVVPAGSKLTFTATSNGQPIAVTWKPPRCGSALPGACGTITQAGEYTAPASPPPSGQVTLDVTPEDTTIPPSGAVLTIVYANGSLNGQYAYSFFGQNSAGAFVEAGSLTFDGQGNITGGEIDGDSNSTVSAGTYQVNADGTGSASFTAGADTASLRLALIDSTQVSVLRHGDVGVVATGTLEKQDSSKFTLAAVQGKYVFQLAGAASGQAMGSLGIAGALTADGSGAVTGGVLDANDSGAVTPPDTVTGTYTAPNSTGRGTLTISSDFEASQTFVYYVLDGERFKLVESNGTRRLAGELRRQAEEPFGASIATGAYAFVLSGTASGNPAAMGGTFTLDGAGALSSPGADLNTSGSFQPSLTLSGTYSVDVNTGRIAATLSVNLNTEEFAFYPRANGAMNVLSLTAAKVLSGEALLRTGLPFNNATVKGNYVTLLSGEDLVSTPGPEAVVGQLVPNGGSAVSGKLDIVATGTTALGTSLTTSNYSVASDSGTGNATLRTGASVFSEARYRIYVVDAGTVLLLESDASRLLTGKMEKQE